MSKIRTFIPVEMLYPAHIGGPAGSVLWLLSLSNNSNIDVEVLTTSKGVDIKKYKIKQNIYTKYSYGRVKYLSTKNVGFSFNFIFHSMVSLLSADIVHLQNLFGHNNLAILLISTLLRKAVLISTRGGLFKTALKNRRKILKKIILIVYKYIFKIKYFHATSIDELNCIKYYFPRADTTLIPNYLYINESTQGWNGNTDYIFVGRITRIKNVKNMIIGFCTSMAYSDKKSRLLILGSALTKDDEKYNMELKQVILQYDRHQKVHLLGQVNGIDKMNYIANSYFMLLLSFSENFGNVVIESLSVGTPVICSDKTPWTNLVEYGCGIEVECNTDSIRLGIDNSYNLSKNNYLKYRELAKDYYHKCNDSKKGAVEWEALYRRLLSK